MSLMDGRFYLSHLAQRVCRTNRMIYALMEIHTAHAQPMGSLIFEGHHKPFTPWLALSILKQCGFPRKSSQLLQHQFLGFIRLVLIFLHLHGSIFMAVKVDPIGNYRCQH